MEILDNFKDNYKKLLNDVNNQDINSYINFIVDNLFASNKYFNDQEPWKKKDNPVRLNTIIYVSLELIRKITILLYPIIPETSLKVLKIFEIDEDKISLETIKNNNFLKLGQKISKLNILFKKIEKND